MWYRRRPYVPVAERRRKAEREARRRTAKGESLSPVLLEGRTIARTFWGEAWCDNLERYSDFANRLPRGRTYLRNGSVLHLQVDPGEVRALVMGSELYEVQVVVAPIPGAAWKAIRSDCAGGIASLVELLQGRLSNGVMERISRPRTGLFPSPREIELRCSCPDWAGMCKHVAAVLYGVGTRLDAQPELLFRLRQVDEAELVAEVGRGLPLATAQPDAARVLEEEDLGALFGLELDGQEPVEIPTPAPTAHIVPEEPPPRTQPEAPTPNLTPEQEAAIKAVEARVSELRSQMAVGTSEPSAALLLERYETWLGRARTGEAFA